jgi:hypothetical protein
MQEVKYGTTFYHIFMFILCRNKKQQGFSGRIQRLSFLDKKDKNVHPSVDTVIKLSHVSSRRYYIQAVFLHRQL